MNSVRTIPLALIDAGERLRALDPAWVALLAEEIAADGLHEPIRVVERGERFQLVAGARRIAAVHLLGWDGIEAKVLPAEALADETAVRLAEIKSDMMRGELTVLDRARYLAAWREAYEALHPQPKRGRKLSKPTSEDLEEMSAQCANIFTDAAKTAFGFSQRTIYLLLKIATISAPVAARIALHPSADKRGELLILADQSEGRQATIAEMLLEEPTQAASVAEAIMLIGGTAQAERVAAYERINERLSAMKPADRERLYELRADEIEIWLARRADARRTKAA